MCSKVKTTKRFMGRKRRPQMLRERKESKQQEERKTRERKEKGRDCDFQF
jgi:hypothetical protein